MDKHMVNEAEARQLLMEGQLVKVSEACALTGLSELAVRNRIKNGLVRTFGGKPMLIALPDLIAAREPLKRGARPAAKPTRKQRAYAAQRAADLAWLAEYREMIAARRGGGGG